MVVAGWHAEGGNAQKFTLLLHVYTVGGSSVQVTGQLKTHPSKGSGDVGRGKQLQNFYKRETLPLQNPTT